MFKRQAIALVAALALASASLVADVTITTTMSMEGGGPGMMAGQPTPRMVMRIKGHQGRNDVDGAGATMSSLIDLEGRRIVMLNSADKTAQVLDGTTASTDKTLPAPKVDVTTKATGRTRTINGLECSETVFTANINMDQMVGGAQMPPEAAAMLEGVHMKLEGSIWSTTSGPGAAEFTAFTKAMLAADMAKIASGSIPGMTGAMDQMMAATAQTPGLPYLTEMTMTVAGTGQMVEMLQQMGPMKMRMEVTSVVTDPIPDSTFEIPEGYKIVK